MNVKVFNPASSKTVTKKRRKKKKVSSKTVKPKTGVTLMKKRRKKRRVKKRSTTSKQSNPVRRKRRRTVAPKRKKRRNPTRRVYMKRRKRRSPKRQTYKRRYRRRKNPTFDFLGVIQTSVLAGIGGVIGLGGTVAVSRIAKVEKNNQKNLITLGIALLSSFMLPKVIKKDQADALLGGLWTVTWLKFLKQVMPSQAQEFLVLGESRPNVDYLVNQMIGTNELGQYHSSDYIDPELNLMGTNEIGYEYDQYDSQIFGRF